MNSNVHNLSHVIDDVLKFGNLTKISAFQFENCLAGLKNRLRNCNRPLEQISRRINELDLDYRNPIDLEQTNFINEPILKYSFDNAGETIFSQIIFNTNLLLDSRKFGDRWFLSKNGKIVEFHFASKRNEEYFLYGNCYENVDNFFTESKSIYIFSLNNDNYVPSCYNIHNVMAKMVSLRNNDELISIPLLHTMK